MSPELESTVKWGYREYASIPTDGCKHEIIDGGHFVNPAPDTYHQRLSRRIQFQLYMQIEQRGLGEIFNAPTDLQLSETDIVQPDLIVVLQRNQAIVTRSRIQGTPDLLVEILSASSQDYDRVQKKELYRRAGVAEYWLVDPEEEVVEQFVLRGNDFVLVGRHEESVTLQIMDGIRVDLTAVW